MKLINDNDNKTIALAYIIDFIDEYVDNVDY